MYICRLHSRTGLSRGKFALKLHPFYYTHKNGATPKCTQYQNWGPGFVEIFGSGQASDKWTYIP